MRQDGSYDCDVLVVGGGLIGLAASVFLAQQGVRTWLVERHAAISIHPKARGVNVRSMEIYRAAGMEAVSAVVSAAMASPAGCTQAVSAAPGSPAGCMNAALAVLGSQASSIATGQCWAALGLPAGCMVAGWLAGFMTTGHFSTPTRAYLATTRRIARNTQIGTIRLLVVTTRGTASRQRTFRR